MSILSALRRIEAHFMSCVNLAGTNATVGYTPEGQIVNVSQGSSWCHPWFTFPQWGTLLDGKTQGWKADILPGWVGDGCPTMRMTVETAPNRTVQREFERQTELSLAAQPVPNKVDLQNPSAPIDVPLYDTGTLDLTFRNIGTDGDSSEAVPPYFSALGVGNPVPALNPDGSNADEVTNALTGVPAPTNRLLRACDLVLTQPRTALTSQITVGNPGADATAITQTLGITAPPPAAKLEITAVSKFVPVVPDPLDLTYTEPNFDQLLVSTVFLLSPPNLPKYSDPDGSWTAYVSHGLFWNLDYMQPAAAYVPAPDPISLLVPLAGGVAQPIVNGLLSPVNDAVQQLLDQLNTNTQQGVFFTV